MPFEEMPSRQVRSISTLIVALVLLSFDESFIMSYEGVKLFSSLSFEDSMSFSSINSESILLGTLGLSNSFKLSSFPF